MKIELKNVQYSAFASEETHCFQAAVYIDGKKRATVSNDGHGGSDMWSDWKVAEEINAYAATLPKVICDFEDTETGKPCELDQTADIIIGNLMNDWLLQRDFRKIYSKRLVWVNEDGTHAYTKPLPNLSKMLENPNIESQIKGKGKLKTLLNRLPFDQAFALFKTSVDLEMKRVRDAQEAPKPPKP